MNEFKVAAISLRVSPWNINFLPSTWKKKKIQVGVGMFYIIIFIWLEERRPGSRQWLSVWSVWLQAVPSVLKMGKFNNKVMTSHSLQFMWLQKQVCLNWFSWVFKKWPNWSKRFKNQEQNCPFLDGAPSPEDVERCTPVTALISDPLGAAPWHHTRVCWCRF